MTDGTTTSTADVQPEDATGGGEQPDTKSKRFSQEEVDHIVGERLWREREKYADYDALKQSADRLAELEAAQKSELEKAQELAEKAQAEKDEALATANERLMRAAFMAEAAQANVAHPEDAYMLADLSGVEIADDGSVTGVEEAVKALTDGGRLVLRKAAAPSLDGGAGGGQPAGETVTLSEEQLRTAQKMGITPEQYAKAIKKE